MAIAPSTTDPAMTELTKFFRVGVTPAWATRGLAMAAPIEATTAAETASVLLSELQPEEERQHLIHISHLFAAHIYSITNTQPNAEEQATWPSRVQR